MSLREKQVLSKRKTLVICMIIVFNVLLFSRARMLIQEIEQDIALQNIRKMNVEKKEITGSKSNYDFALLDKSLAFLNVSNLEVKKEMENMYRIFFTVPFEEVKSVLQVVDGIFTDMAVKEISITQSSKYWVRACLKAERI